MLFYIPRLFFKALGNQGTQVYPATSKEAYFSTIAMIEIEYGLDTVYSSTAWQITWGDIMAQQRYRQ